VSLVTTDAYLPGAEVLVASLRATKTARDIIILVTPNVTEATRRKLRADRVLEVEPIAAPHEATDACWSGSGYTKLRVWELEDYDALVYLDADALVLEPIDDLFERRVDFAAAPDVFPPDKFNAGVLVLRPNRAVFARMLEAAPTLASHDKGDTGFLNSFFPDWFHLAPDARLPFRYNAQRTLFWMTHAREPGYWNAVKPIKVLHFSSSPKPWDAGAKKGECELLWWNHFLALKTGGGSDLANLLAAASCS